MALRAELAECEFAFWGSMMVLHHLPATKSFAPGVNGSWVFQLRLRSRSEVPIDERPAQVVGVVAGDYCQIAGLDLTAVREVSS